MRNNRHLFKSTLVLALLATSLALTVVLGGCGQSGGPDQAVQAKTVTNIQTMRTYFDKVQGDYSKLSDADKAEFVKLAGSQGKADQTWAIMKNGPSRTPAASTGG